PAAAGYLPRSSRRATRSAAHLDLRTVEDEVDLLEVRLGIPRDLLFGEHRTGFRAPARVADHSRVIADYHDHGVAFVLKHSEGVEHDQMSHVQVWSGRIEPQLHAQPVPPFEPCAQMILDVDLDRPLTPAVE